MKVCQRPERAFFISTVVRHIPTNFLLGCQRPERAFFISTQKGYFKEVSL